MFPYLQFVDTTHSLTFPSSSNHLHTPNDIRYTECVRRGRRILGNRPKCAIHKRDKLSCNFIYVSDLPWQVFVFLTFFAFPIFFMQRIPTSVRVHSLLLWCTSGILGWLRSVGFSVKIVVSNKNFPLLIFDDWRRRKTYHFPAY